MWWWLVSAAFGGVPGYQACCAASAAIPCPTELQATGPGTTVVAEGSAFRSTGVWTLACDGKATFDGASSQLTTAPLADGSVIAPLPQNAAMCFEASCVLPAALCVRHDGARAHVVSCADGTPADLSLWQTLPVEDTRAAVVSGHVLLVRDTRADGVPVAHPAKAAITTAPAGSASAGLPTPASIGLDLGVPPPPPDPCKPTADRIRSAALGDDGNAAVMKGDYDLALVKYRGAIKANNCNAFAWADLGAALLALHEPARAKSALEVATRLMPAHYQAWTNLGAALEATGDPAAASAAYAKAVDVHPGFAPATEGLARTRPR